MTARDQILSRLRTARAAVRLPRVDAPALPDGERRSTMECVARFVEEATALGIECAIERSPEGVRARVGAMISGRRVLTWDPSQLPYGVGDIVRDAAMGSSPREQQAAADIGVTGSDAAIAETGSLVMLSAPGRSRAVSLLPPVHLAIVRPSDLYYTMSEFFDARHDELLRAASCTFITGPSRTADIELTLTLGIHGPGRVVVVIGPDQRDAVRGGGPVPSDRERVEGT